MELSARNPDRPGYRPLYQQVRELLLARIASGAWRPAEALPSEQALAEELGVSQGTVRKALDSLAADSLVERHQGKGTYVAQHTKESANFRFFRLSADSSGQRTLPDCRQSTIVKRRANSREQKILNIQADADVYHIARTRYVNDAPILFDEISVPADRFPALDAHQPLPNTLYTLYQSDYGVSVAGAKEEIKAVAANKDVARALDIPLGSPVLLVTRCGFGLDDMPIEYRRTHYHTDNTHYAIELN